VPPDGDTGHQIEKMRQATELLHKVLAGRTVDRVIDWAALT